MIIADTSFLSSLAKIGRIGTVFRVLNAEKIIVAQAAYDELKQAPVFEILLPYFSSGKLLVKSIPFEDFPETLGKGESESIALAKSNKALLLIDDQKAIAHAEERGVSVLDIPSFLVHCKIHCFLTAKELGQIVDLLKKKDYYEFESGVKDFLLS